jgi:hypothetical protein
MTNADIGLPEFTVRKPAKKKKVKVYKKSESLVRLGFEYKQWYYSNKAIPSRTQMDFKFADNGANALTKSIMAYLTMKGYFAARINSGATYDVRLGIFRKGSGATAGMADINAIINGRSVSIEVKYGRDKIRPSQLKVKAEIEAAGGIYFIARTFDGLLESIKQYI